MLTMSLNWLAAHTRTLLRVAGILAIGILIGVLLQRLARRLMERPFGKSTAILTGKAVRNLVVVLAVFSALSAVGIWFASADLLAVRGSILCEIKARFDREGIEIPFPHLSIYSGSETLPFRSRGIRRGNTRPRSRNASHGPGSPWEAWAVATGRRARGAARCRAGRRSTRRGGRCSGLRRPGAGSPASASRWGCAPRW